MTPRAEDTLCSSVSMNPIRSRLVLRINTDALTFAFPLYRELLQPVERRVLGSARFSAGEQSCCNEERASALHRSGIDLGGRCFFSAFCPFHGTFFPEVSHAPAFREPPSRLVLFERPRNVCISAWQERPRFTERRRMPVSRNKRTRGRRALGSPKEHAKQVYGNARSFFLETIAADKLSRPSDNAPSSAKSTTINLQFPRVYQSSKSGLLFPPPVCVRPSIRSIYARHVTSEKKTMREWKSKRAEAKRVRRHADRASAE